MSSPTGTRARRRWAERFLRAYMSGLREILAARQPEVAARFPGQAPGACATCAFNPATDRMQGWDTTTSRLLSALNDGQPFYCHHGMPYVKGAGWIADMQNLTLCRGWADLAGHGDFLPVMIAAVKKAGPMPAGAEICA